jgi:hypothetical protein
LFDLKLGVHSLKIMLNAFTPFMPNATMPDVTQLLKLCHAVMPNGIMY